MAVQRFICGNCGGKATVPPGYLKAKVRCEHCGYYADVPAAMRAVSEAVPELETPFDEPAAPRKPPVRARVAETFGEDEPPPEPQKGRARAVIARPQRDPHDHRAEFEEQIGVGLPLLAGDDVEHDGPVTTPYAVPGTGLKPCPECRGELPIEATFCVHCGWEIVGKKKSKAQREFEPIDKAWHEGWSPAFRLQLFIALQFANIALLALGTVATGHSFRDAGHIGTTIFMNLVNVALQAFILGSFETLRVVRDPGGKCAIYKTRRYMFFKMPEFKIQWKLSSGIGILASHNPGLIAYIICFYLLATGCIPGILFFVFIIRPERFSAALCNEFGGTDETIFLCKSRLQAEEVARTIAEASGLRYHNIL